MGRPLVQLAALVLLDGVAAVDVHGTVRIDGHHHLADVAVDPPLLKPEGAQIWITEIWKKNTFYMYLMSR